MIKSSNNNIVPIFLALFSLIAIVITTVLCCNPNSHQCLLGPMVVPFSSWNLAPTFILSLHAFSFCCGLSYLHPINFNTFRLDDQSMHNPCWHLIVCDSAYPKHPRIYILQCCLVFKLQIWGFQLEFPWTPKQGIPFFCIEMLVLQVKFGIKAFTIQLLDTWKENNIMYFNIH